MTTFEDGPAAGVTLNLQRAPLFLRVVQAQSGKWDALDRLDDAPTAHEKLFVYEIVGKPMRAFVRPGGLVVIATYRLVEAQPVDADMRTIEAWHAWCLANAGFRTSHPGF